VNEIIVRWLNDYEKAVSTKDYVNAKALYTESPVVFGTRVNWETNIDEYYERQWLAVWSTSRDFNFTKILALNKSLDLSFCAVLWSNVTVIGAKEIYREGRATFIFKNIGMKIKAVHSHFSETPIATNW
jgi:hypothetical protein